MGPEQTVAGRGGVAVGQRPGLRCSGRPGRAGRGAHRAGGWASRDARLGVCIGGRAWVWEPAAWRPAHPRAICGVQVGFVVSSLSAPRLPSLSGSVLSAMGHREPGRTALVLTGHGKTRLGPDTLMRQGGLPGGGGPRRERWGFTGNGGLGPAVLTAIPKASGSSWLLRKGHSVGWPGRRTGSTCKAFG